MHPCFPVAQAYVTHGSELIGDEIWQWNILWSWWSFWLCTCIQSATLANPQFPFYLSEPANVGRPSRAVIQRLVLAVGHRSRVGYHKDHRPPHCVLGRITIAYFSRLIVFVGIAPHDTLLPRLTVGKLPGTFELSATTNFSTEFFSHCLEAFRTPESHGLFLAGGIVHVGEAVTNLCHRHPKMMRCRRRALPVS